MGSSQRRERSKRLAARAKRLPAEQQGPLIVTLLGSAVFTIALQAWWLVLVCRAGRRVMGQRDYRLSRMLQAVRSPTLAVVTGLVVVHRFGHPLLVGAEDRFVAAHGGPIGSRSGLTVAG